MHVRRRAGHHPRLDLVAGGRAAAARGGGAAGGALRAPRRRPQSSTDADAIHNAGRGVATVIVSIPNRYMHSPSEMVSVDDLDRAAAIIAEACRAVTAETDFTDR